MNDTCGPNIKPATTHAIHTTGTFALCTAKVRAYRTQIRLGISQNPAAPAADHIWLSYSVQPDTYLTKTGSVRNTLLHYDMYLPFIYTYCVLNNNNTRDETGTRRRARTHAQRLLNCTKMLINIIRYQKK